MTDNQFLLTAEIVLFFINYLGMIGEVNEYEKDIHLVISVIPVLNVVGAIVSICKIMKMIYVSKGRCILQHDYKKVYNSNGSVLNRSASPYGGYEKYECQCCNHIRYVQWKAF